MRRDRTRLRGRPASLAHVDFIIVGGVAANLHGALRTTLDLDVVYSRDPVNLGRLVAALAPYNLYLRGAPGGLPFTFDLATLERGLNVTLTRTIGELDLLGEVAGGGTWEGLRPGAAGVLSAGHLSSRRQGEIAQRAPYANRPDERGSRPRLVRSLPASSRPDRSDRSAG